MFGGYHPLLGSLVMKHGGHTDLIELVSLAKIEREMGVRSKWKIDRLWLDWRQQQQQQQQQQLQQLQQQQQQQQQHQRRRQHRSTMVQRFGGMFSYANYLHPSSSEMSASTDHSPSSNSSHHHQYQNDNTAQKKKDSKKTMFQALAAAHFLKPSSSSSSAASTTTSQSPAFSHHHHHHRQQHESDDNMTQKKNSRKKTFKSLSSAYFWKPSSSSSSSFTSISSKQSASHHRDGDDNGQCLHSRQAQDANDFLQQQQEQRQRIEEEIQAIHHAVEDMIRRTPSFRMIYISPMHVRERAEELKYRSFTSSSSMMKKPMAVPGQQPSMDLRLWREKLLLSSSTLSTLPEKNTATTGRDEDGMKMLKKGPSSSSSSMRQSGLVSAVGTKLAGSNCSMPSSRMGRELHLFGSPLTKNSSVHVEDDHVDLCFGGNYHFWKEEECQSVKEENDEDDDAKDSQQSHTTGPDGKDGYASLTAFVDKLRYQQELNEWKITLAQEKIGISSSSDDTSQSSSKTASYLLAKGMLHGPLLHHLIDSKIQVIRNLQLLTMPEESNLVEKVRAEYEEIVSCQQKENCKVSAANVSKLANMFVGRAIHKNFDPTNGRFVMLRQFGIDLRNKNIHLSPMEVVPANHLETLFGHLNLEQPVGRFNDNSEFGSECNRVISGHELMDSTFDMNYNFSDHLLGNRSTISPEKNHPIFASGLDQWQSLLELSTSMKHPNATQPIWTCGLTDGGLHNMFLSEDYMWLFDLGEPTLEPIPAFLTKFLMSFFHTLGMEEDEKGDWIVRFEQDDSGKLRLTEETKEILPKVIRAFNTVLDRLIKELFGGEEEIRVLLVRYVVTQLISDCAFCIEKWRIKGGGDELRSEHQENLEKWLWRALWDVYISEEIRRRYLSRMLFRRQFESRDLSSLDLCVG